MHVLALDFGPGHFDGVHDLASGSMEVHQHRIGGCRFGHFAWQQQVAHVPFIRTSHRKWLVEQMQHRHGTSVRTHGKA